MNFHFVKIYSMKKNKFIINKLNIKKIIPTLALLGMINSTNVYSMTFPKDETSKLIKSISLGYETLNYNTANYSDKEAFNALTAILNSDLNKLIIDDKTTNEDIHKEINHHSTKLNDNTLKLSRMYKALENETINKSGLTLQEIYKQPSQLRNKIETLHYIHTTLDRLNLVRQRANKDSLDSVFKLFKNENLAFEIDSANDIRIEINFLLYAFKEDIRTFLKISSGEDQEKESLIEEIYSNLNELEYLITQTEFTQANSKYIYYLINKIPEQLYSTKELGTLSMCRGLINIYASELGNNALINNVEFFGYDVSNLTNTKNKKQSYNSNVAQNTERLTR